jgi:DNA-binding CsgD family transcriptional regulator
VQLHADDHNELERARNVRYYGEWLRRRHRRRDRSRHLHEALETFERIGARPWAERARAELRASGERLRARGPAAHERLTNKEIGAHLFLSPKTVEFHLSRAYRRLDVNSRIALAKLLASQPAEVERLTA